MERMKIPFSQSFQTGRVFRKGNPDAAAWKHIKRVGTLENINRIAKASNNKGNSAEIASLRIKQALELHDAAQNTTTLTRPLLLYYCALNLVRGALIARHGEAGATSHGMRYITGGDILNCSAKTSKSGTFPQLMQSVWGGHASSAENKSVTLLQILAQTPELRHDFHLVGIDTPLIAEVHVNAYINDETELKFFIPGISQQEFQNQWQTLLPWFSNLCTYEGGTSLRPNERLDKPEKAQKFCALYLMRDLQWRQSPVWYDHVARPNAVLLPRVAAYLSGLFILSNVSRYEPEKLMPAIESTDLAFVIESYLDCAERHIPLLVIELLEGATYFE